MITDPLLSDLSVERMTAMDFMTSDLGEMPSNFLDMIENDINGHLLDLDNMNPDKLDLVLSGEASQDCLSSNMQMDYKPDDATNLNVFQGLQWNDLSKVPQSLIDASHEIENNNPNLLVNPQMVLPMHSMQQIQNTTNVNQVNVRNGVPVKINGQDALLTPTQHPQIQYVTVQNVGTDSLNNTQIGYAVQPMMTICPQQVQTIRTIASPSQSSPVLVEHLQTGVHSSQLLNNKIVHAVQKKEKVYPKPVYSYSCLIAMALKNSRNGTLPVNEIYHFMTENFPYFKIAPDGWKNSVRHNLSLNKCFAKVDTVKPPGAHTRKGCLWKLNPAKVEKMDDEIVKWRKKDPESVKHSMSKPENLELIESGKAGPPKDTPIIVTTPGKPEPNLATQMTQTRHQPNVRPQQIVCKREAAVVVQPDGNLLELKPGNFLCKDLNMDPALSELALQNSLWDDDLASELSVGIGNPNMNVCSSPLTSPTGNIGNMMQYHGNITYTTSYTTSPVANRNPPSCNSTPSKLYPQTTTSLHSHTPTKLHPQVPPTVITV